MKIATDRTTGLNSSPHYFQIDFSNKPAWTSNGISVSFSEIGYFYHGKVGFEATASDPSIYPVPVRSLKRYKSACFSSLGAQRLQNSIIPKPVRLPGFVIRLAVDIYKPWERKPIAITKLKFTQSSA